MSIFDRFRRPAPTKSFSQERPIAMPRDREPAEPRVNAHARAFTRDIFASPGVAGVGREYAKTANQYVMGGPLGLLNDMPVLSRKGLEIVDEMKTDDMVGTCIELKKIGALSSPWSWEAASDDPDHQKHAEYLTEVFDQLDAGEKDADGVNVGLKNRMRGILSAIEYGFSVTNVVLTTLDRGDFKGKLGLADLKTKPPHHFTFDVDDYLNILPDGIIYTGYLGQPERLPLENFLVYSYRSQFGNPYGYADTIRAYDRWNSKQYVQKMHDVYLERIASGSWIALWKNDNGAPPPADEINAVDAFLIGGTARQGLRVSDLWTIECHEAGGSADVWGPALDARNIQIARAIFTPDKLGFSAQAESGGAYAMSKTHMDFYTMILVDLQQDLARLMKSLGRRLVKDSFGVQTKYPNFAFAPLTDEQKAWWLETVFTAISKGVLDKADPTVSAKVRENLDLPEAEEPVNDPTDPTDPNAPVPPDMPDPNDPNVPADDPNDMDEEFDPSMDPEAGFAEALRAMGSEERVIVVGGPRTGKTMLSVRSAYQHGRPHHHTDSLMGTMHWSDASTEVSKWFDRPGRWVVEGVATVRALRKWLMANPDKPVPAAILLMETPRMKRTKGQRTMAKGVRTVWNAILPELEKRGAKIMEAKGS